MNNSMRIADRLEAARRSRFVGREPELALFRSALLDAHAPFAVLHLCGPGGVGKSTLLREYRRLTIEAGRAALLLDARDVEPSPSGFLLAVSQALQLDCVDPAALAAARRRSTPATSLKSCAHCSTGSFRKFRAIGIGARCTCA